MLPRLRMGFLQPLNQGAVGGSVPPKDVNPASLRSPLIPIPSVCSVEVPTATRVLGVPYARIGMK